MSCNYESYDCIVMGAGMAGCSAAINMARAGYRVALIDKEFIGGAIRESAKVTNYIGMIGMSGIDIAAKLEEEISQFENIDVIYEEIVGARRESPSDHPSDNFYVVTDEHLYWCKTLIAAIGLERNKLEAKGIDAVEDAGKVSYCALCDGMFYADQTVAVIGSGNTAVHDAVYLSNICKRVIIMKRHDLWKCDKANRQLIDKISNIEIFTDTPLSFEMLGTGQVNIKGEYFNEAVDGVFIAIGSHIEDDFIDKNVNTETKKGVKVYHGDGYNGFFSAGDYQVYGTSIPCQLQSAAYSGMMAALNAMNFLESL